MGASFLPPLKSAFADLAILASILMRAVVVVLLLVGCACCIDLGAAWGDCC